MVRGKNCRETTDKDCRAVMIFRYLVIAFSAPAILPTLFRGFAVFPAGVRFLYTYPVPVAASQ